MTTVPRPTTNLSADQQKALLMAVEAANRAKRSQQETDMVTDFAWQAILAARALGVPDELLCDETGFSRATLNRKFGRRGQP